jgi:Flp pilus assembly protein TadB
MSKVRHPSNDREPRSPWTVLDTAMTTPRAALRLALLILLPLAALVAVVALIAPYLGAIVAATLGMTGTGGYVAHRLRKRRRGDGGAGTVAVGG